MASAENNSIEPVSIIVPCLNEERYIGTLLRCLARQTFQNFEIIVVDGGSQDDTQRVVEQRAAASPVLEGKVRWVLSPRKGVAAQRNYGVSLARFDRLVFFDADVQLPEHFLEVTLGEIDKKDLDMATTVFEPISSRVDDKLAYMVGNLYIQLQQFLQPVAMGFCIFTTKTIHQEIGGFDEEIVPGEDYDYVHRAAKLDIAFRVLAKEPVYTSVRRLNKEGRITYYQKAIMAELLSLVKDRKEAAESINYQMGNEEAQ